MRATLPLIMLLTALPSCTTQAGASHDQPGTDRDASAEVSADASATGGGANADASSTGGNANPETDFDASGTEGDASIPAFSVDVARASDLAPEAPGTVGIVKWSLQGVIPESAEIRFGLDTEYGMVAPVDLNEPDSRTLLLGMKPNRTYHLQVVAMKGDQRFQSADCTLETGPATNLVNLTPTIHDAASHVPGFIVSTYIQTPPPGVVMSEFLRTGSMVLILDGDGDVVWWYQSKVGLTPRARMSYDGKSIWLVPEREDTAGAQIELVSMDTLQSRVYDSVDGASHDAAVVDKDVLAYIDYGESDCGSVFELRPDGSELEIFESTEYLPGMAAPECHLNAVRYNEAERLYSISDRLNGMFVIDRQGALQWRLSDIVPNEVYGGEQHGHQLLANSLLLFANAGGEGGNAAAYEFSLTDGAEIFRYDPGISSIWYGDVQRLPEGNTLITFSIAGVMHEIDPNGKLVMSINGDMFGYAEWRPSLYGPPIDIQR